MISGNIVVIHFPSKWVKGLILSYLLGLNFATAGSPICDSNMHMNGEVPGIKYVEMKGKDNYYGVVNNYLTHRRAIYEWSVTCNRRYDISNLHSVEHVFTRISQFLNTRLLKPSGYELFYRDGVVIIEVKRQASYDTVLKSLVELHLAVGITDRNTLMLKHISSIDEVEKKLHKTTLLYGSMGLLISPEGDVFAAGQEFMSGWIIEQVLFDTIKFRTSGGEYVDLQR